MWRNRHASTFSAWRTIATFSSDPNSARAERDSFSEAVADNSVRQLIAVATNDFIVLPNVQDEPRPWLARAVLLGARIVTAMVVGSGALLARLSYSITVVTLVRRRTSRMLRRHTWLHCKRQAYDLP